MGDALSSDGVFVTWDVLRDVAEESGKAPSILNTQPWRWRVRQGSMDLYADRARQVRSIDPVGRLMLVSCGAALHHARVTLAYRGYEAWVRRWPDPRDSDHLATVTVARSHEPSRSDTSDYRSLRERRTERRLAPSIPVPRDALAVLRKRAGLEDTGLHHLSVDQLPTLALAAKLAQQRETRDSPEMAELREWERRSRVSGQGVPPETVTAPVDRPVPLRDLTSGGATLLHPGLGDDRFAEYLVLATVGDGPADWLRAGEATSSVWLAATGCGLSASVISDVIEDAEARRLVGSLLLEGGHPQLVMRVAVDSQPTPPPATPRRPATEYIDIEPRG